MAPISLKSLYSKIFCQTTSTDELLLSVGNSEGKLHIYDLSNFSPLNEGVRREKLGQPLHSFSAHNDSIYSAASSKEFCITGVTGAILGWRWQDLKKGVCKAAWNISLACDQSNFGTPEVNGLVVDSDRGWVWAACGDWRTRAFDLETGQETVALSGHEDYVHDVVLSGTQVVSAGDDGNVLVCDPRAGREPRLHLRPSDTPMLRRPNLGEFVASVDVHNDWIVCGGGPRAGIFHLRSLAATVALPPRDDVAVHVTKFTRKPADRGNVITAGACSCVFVCNMSGDITAEIGSSCSAVYSVHIMDDPHTASFIGGTGPLVDVCTNLNYRDHTINTAVTM